MVFVLLGETSVEGRWEPIQAPPRLPILPRRWQRGRVAGLVARGGHVFDISWQQGRLRSFRVRSQHGGDLVVMLPTTSGSRARVEAQRRVESMQESEDGTVRLRLAEDEAYEFEVTYE